MPKDWDDQIMLEAHGEKKNAFPFSVLPPSATFFRVVLFLQTVNRSYAAA